MRCSKCGAENPAGKKFCGDCGAQLVNLCAKCGGDNPPGKQFCGECGTALREPSAAAGANSKDLARRLAETPAPETLEGERKAITVLFADIKGSMGLIEALDPEEARAVVDPALAIMAEAVNRYGGSVAQSTGDGIFALFGAPVAHEDDPQRAIYAGLRMQTELGRYSDRLRADGKSPVEVRIGINTGEVVMRAVGKDASHSEYLPAGHAVGLASRLQTLAPTGSIAIGEATRRLVEGYFQLKSLGATRIKGVSEQVNLHEVTGIGALRTRFQIRASRGLSRFVGRDSELRQMSRALELSSEGHGQIVAAIAEPGVGKSRLFFEFKAKRQAGCMVLEAFSISHGKASAYLPVLELLHSYFDIKPEDDSLARRAKVAGKIATLDRTLEDTVPFLFGLLGIVDGPDPLAQMDGQVRRRRTLDAIKRILLRESLSRPLIVIFEDLHWIDGETQSFLNSIADSLANAKILLLVNYRPEYSHPWGSKTYYTQLRIDPLGMESADEMLAAILGDGVELGPLKRLIIEKTEGNPFFMEEAVQALFDDGALIRNGAVRLTRALSQLRIPPTVQAILASRIDKLPQDEKELLQTSAVIGREFSFALLNEVVRKSEDELNRMLGDLQMGEFIYEQPAAGELEFLFKHALTQEVAANSMLLERRKLLHEEIGAAIESLYAGRLDDYIDQLAHHYSHSPHTEKAVEFLHRAGRLAMRRLAYSPAAEHLTSALALLKTLPEGEERDAEELEILSPLSIVLHHTKGYGAPERAEATTRARELAEKKGDTEQLYMNLFGSWQVALGYGDYDASKVIAERMLELAQSEEDRSHDGEAGTDNPAARSLTYESIAGRSHRVALAGAHGVSHVSCYYLGDLPGSERHFSRQCELSNARGVNPLTSSPGAFSYASWTAWRMGRIVVARTRMAEAVTAADGHSDAEQKIVPPLMAAMERGMFTVKGREALARKVIELSEKFEIPHMAAQGRIDLGVARAELGHPAEGVALIRQGIAEKEQTMSRLAHTHNYTVLAETQALAGEIDDALVTAEKAVELNPQELVDRPDAYRVRGQLRLRKGMTELAEADLREAVALAKSMSARMLELSATTALCKLLRDSGRRGEARGMLAEIYDWFTEGFDTADLKEAKALLDELSN